MTHRIYFPQFNKEIEILKGSTVLEHARKLGISINAPCDGIGTCGQCRIVIKQGYGALNERTAIEKKLLDSRELRLACQARVLKTSDDIYVKVFVHGDLQILTAEKENNFKLNPLIKSSGEKVIFNKTDIIDSYSGKIYGIAADIGTTTIVLHLMDLESGKCASTSAFENPQRKIDGDNVINRIDYDAKNPGKLQNILISHINKEIEKMPCSKHDIYEMVIVGNPTMRDIFFGLDVQTIGVKPFKSLTELEGGSTAIYKKASELSLDIHPNANVYGSSLIGSHVGSDITAVCLSTGLFEDENETALAIDIGTNGELVLKYKNKLTATSCAAGSALEPIPAIKGAIERLTLSGDKAKWKAIGGGKAVGLCGSGIIDLLSEMLKNNIMDDRGYLTQGKAFNVTDSIKITQNQIKGQDGLMWSKAAISLGIKALLEKENIDIYRLDRIYLAGSFGNYIDKQNARKIGLIPAVLSEQIIQVGNAAAEGAKEMLLSKERRELAEKSAQKVKHINLESIPNYGERLMLDEQNFKELR